MAKIPPSLIFGDQQAKSFLADSNVWLPSIKTKSISLCINFEAFSEVSIIGSM